MRNSGKLGNYGLIARAICRQTRRLFVLYVTAKSLSNQQPLLVKLREKKVYLFHLFLTSTIIR
jgi:hypothetical protein